MVGGYQLPGVLVFQIAQIEAAAPGNLHCGLKKCWGINLGQLLQRTQVTFAIGEQPVAGLFQRAMMADGGQGVLQGPPAPGVHVHIAAGHGGDLQLAGQSKQLLQSLGVIRPWCSSTASHSRWSKRVLSHSPCCWSGSGPGNQSASRPLVSVSRSSLSS